MNTVPYSPYGTIRRQEFTYKARAVQIHESKCFKLTLKLAFTDHVESPRDRDSTEVYSEVMQYVIEADSAGYDYFWFSEHHGNTHFGHLPDPLLMAVHAAAKTSNISLGAAIICLNLHHPLTVAESVAVADHLTGGRISTGFGSGSTPEEFAWFGQELTVNEERHKRFEDALEVVLEAWTGQISHTSKSFSIPSHSPIPKAGPDLHKRSWLAVNSSGSAAIAGRLGFNMMFSHLRTPEQYSEYSSVYRESGGIGMIAANRPVYVGETDEHASFEIEPALRLLWRRFQSEGKIPAALAEPEQLRDLAAHPINFLFGGPESVAMQITELRAKVGFDVLNAEMNWAKLTPDQIKASIRRLAAIREHA